MSARLAGEFVVKQNEEDRKMFWFPDDESSRRSCAYPEAFYARQFQFPT